MVKLNHMCVKQLANSGYFDNVTSYAELESAILAFATNGIILKSDDEKHESYERMGDAFEVYTEFFFKKYDGNPFFGVKDIVDTSREDTKNGRSQKAGYDFRYVDLRGNQGRIQSKFRQNPCYKFSLKEFYSFVFETDIEGIHHRDLRVWFTNLYNDNDSIFDAFSLKAKDSLFVIGRLKQEEIINRDPTFWLDFVASIQAAKEKNVYVTPPKPRDYQQSAIDAALSL